MTATTNPKAVVIRYIEAVRDGDADVIHASFAQDATWHYPGDLPVVVEDRHVDVGRPQPAVPPQLPGDDGHLGQS
ncbi:nuclear transport factor 2 family protein, partial [Streptomyces sp. NPDC049577]|uniref:nuclear transport factor 2 family protein n=1 Tax=Streptomyces sp. NPDC049577 TaxID=3155153 RepID=UPI00342B4390